MIIRKTYNNSNSKNEEIKLNIQKLKKYFNEIYKQISEKSLYNKDMSFTIAKKHLFYSSSSSIIKYKNKYIINTRLVNYKLNLIGKSNITGKCISINKITTFDIFFNEINSKYIFPLDDNSKYIGIEDIRLFNFKDEIYFIGSVYNKYTDKVQIVSNKYILNENYNPLLIIPSFKTDFNWEKNWVFFNNNGKLNIIYKWFPIYICEIDYDDKKLNLIKSINNLPYIFSNFRGSTNGIEYDNKIWFIVHQQSLIINDVKGYVHYFVVFDKKMNLLGYSNSFNFENKIVEFCIGMEITDKNNFIITYSTLDCTSKLIILSSIFVNSLINNYIHSY